MITEIILFFSFISTLVIIKRLDKRVKELKYQNEIKQQFIDQLQLNDDHMDRLRQPFIEGYLKELNKKENGNDIV